MNQLTLYIACLYGGDIEQPTLATAEDMLVFRVFAGMYSHGPQELTKKAT